MNLLKLAQDKVHKAIGAKPASANDFNVGDSLIHTTSGVRGVLEGVEICDGRVLLTIRTPSGQFLHKLGRQEFKLASEAFASELAPAHAAPPAAAPVETHGRRRTRTGFENGLQRRNQHRKHSRRTLKRLSRRRHRNERVDSGAWSHLQTFQNGVIQRSTHEVPCSAD